MEITNRSPKYNPLYKKVYRTHRSMMNRCYSKGNSGYKNYGKRGVTVDERWHKLDNFIEDIDKIDGFNIDEYMKGNLQLDKDIKNKNNKIYSLENCKFVTLQENSANRRSNRDLVIINLEKDLKIYTNNLSKFCEENNLDLRTCWNILNKTKNTKTHKGYQFFFRDSFNDKEIYRPKTYIGKNKNTGEVVEFQNLKEFVLDKGLASSSAVNACIRGDQNYHRGWSFKIKEE